MNGIVYYANLLSSTSRIEAFQRAIAAEVRPGDRVLDLGTGLGTFAFFAARSGARRVWGVDPDPVIHTAEQLAMGNGLSDRVEFVRGYGKEVELPSPIDLLIFEDFPSTLLDMETHRLLRRVVGETLAPEGRMIPRAARMCVAPVQSDAHYRKLFPLGDQEEGLHGLDWTALRPLLANTPRRDELLPQHLLAPPIRSPVVPLLPVPGPSQLRVEGAWDAGTSGRVDMLALWFDLEVSPGNWISNEPSPDPEPWGQWVLPVEPPLEVESPERVHASVGRETLPNDGHGWLTWEVRSSGEVRRGHEFAGLNMGPEDLGAPSVTPRPGER